MSPRRSIGMKTTCRVLVACIGGWLFVVTLVPSLHAQSDTERVIPPLEHLEFLRKVREGELDSTKPVTQRQKLKFSQIREDFQRIQAVNSETIRAAISEKSIKVDKVVKAAAEIQRRAVRLKTNLALPSTASQSAELERKSSVYRDQLEQLDRDIWSFVSNPIFKTTEVLDVNLASKASSDLQAIIDVSRLLKDKRFHD